MVRWRNAGTATQDKLITHKLAIVLAHRAGFRPVTGIGLVLRLGPLPEAIIELIRGLGLRLGGQDGRVINRVWRLDPVIAKFQIK